MYENDIDCMNFARDVARWLLALMAEELGHLIALRERTIQSKWILEYMRKRNWPPF